MDAGGKSKGLAGQGDWIMSSVVCDFWEEHCIECGEPVCYASCAKYLHARTGRCKRFSFDSGAGLHEWRTGERTIAFSPWGKLELLWHGRMAKQWVQRAMLFANGIAEPVALLIGVRVYRIWRSIRWRLVKMCSWYSKPPTIWHIACVAEQDETLVSSIADAEGNEVFRKELAIKAGERFKAKWRLPKVEEGALFRVCSYDGTNGKIKFKELLLMDDDIPFVKCVAWDLDGTLWDGTLVEDGIECIRQKEDVIAAIKRLDSCGIVNSIVSKNDESVVIDALKTLGIEECFVYPQIGWGAKSVAVKRLAQQMNIGLEAIAFVDDTEHERVEVKAECPAVAVLAPEDVATFVEAACQHGSQMGSARRKMYRDEMARGKAIAQDFAGDAEAFLSASGLAIELLDVPTGSDIAARCLELVQRTNQLTLTAHRYDEMAFNALLGDTTCKAVRAHDKYGDFGIVGFAAWTQERLRELVFSCRIAKKGVERRVLDMLPKGLAVDMVATDRNAPIREIVEEWMR